MKKSTSIIAALCTSAVLFSSCSDDIKDNSIQNDIHIGNTIRQDIESQLTPENTGMLWDGTDSILINAHDGKVSATARVSSGANIPAFAETFCPIIIEAASSSECVIDYITIQAYEKDSDGSIKKSTLENWDTHDGVTGTFIDENNDVMKANADIDYIKNYYDVVTGAVFGDELDVYQGEWQCQEQASNRVIVNGTSVNFVSESEIGSKSFRHVTTFKFGYDESNNLSIFNDQGRVCYNISLYDDGTLHIDSSDKNETYKKISDNTEIPAEKVNPSIGMTEKEVYESTWGAPNKRNKTTTEYGTHEQWVYDDGYIYFDNGVVTSIQE